MSRRFGRRTPNDAPSISTFDPAQQRYVSIPARGDPMNPVPLTINGTVWIYGGQTAGPDGVIYRTINDFSKSDVPGEPSLRKTERVDHRSMDNRGGCDELIAAPMFGRHRRLT